MSAKNWKLTASGIFDSPPRPRCDRTDTPEDERVSLAEKVVQFYEHSGESARRAGAPMAAAEYAVLAKLVRAGALCAGTTDPVRWADERDARSAWDSALAELAAALGVEDKP